MKENILNKDYINIVKLFFDESNFLWPYFRRVSIIDSSNRYSFLRKVYYLFWETEREIQSGGRERGRENTKQASHHQHVAWCGLELMNPEIMTRALRLLSRAQTRQIYAL